MFLLPPPSAIAVSFIANAPLLLSHGWITTAEILLGFALSIVVGIPLALAIFLWPTFSRSVLPLLVSSQAMPKVAVAPLFLVWFGFGLLPKVLIAFLIAAGWFGYSSWTAVGDVKISTLGWIFLSLGIVVTTLVGAGLMGLLWPHPLLPTARSMCRCWEAEGARTTYTRSSSLTSQDSRTPTVVISPKATLRF